MHYYLILLLTSFSLQLFSQTYIKNITIVDVENNKLIPNQTVLYNDKILKIGPKDKMHISDNLKTIDGTGKYLIPGMTDAHVHFFQNGGLYTRPDAIDLRKEKPYYKEINYAHQNMDEVCRRYLQNGITNVIDVGATYNFLKQRDTLYNKTTCPTIQMTGPLLTTWEPAVFEGLKHDEPFTLIKTIDDAKKAVQSQLPHKPDFIKVWYIVKRDTISLESAAKKYLPIVKTVIEEAHKNNLKVAIHATERITAQLAVEAGCDFLVHSIDDEIIKQDFILLLKSKNTILCPTLIVHEGYLKTFNQTINFTLHDLYKADPIQLGTLLDVKHISDTTLINKYKKRFLSNEMINSYLKMDSISLINLKKLADAGILIATGTDAGNIGTLHASSYLSELQMMKKAGMTNWQILQASTINGAKVLNKEKEFGSIAVGKNSNMVILNSNPLDKIENITDIYRVINKGNALNPDSLIKETPTALAQRQLNAYNLRNIEAFIEPYDDDVEIYIYPNTFMYKGKNEMRKRYADMFQNTPNLHCELKGRIVQGNVVIDSERVQKNNDIIEATAIYHIENNKIKRVYFIR